MNNVRSYHRAVPPLCEQNWINRRLFHSVDTSCEVTREFHSRGDCFRSYREAFTLHTSLDISFLQNLPAASVQFILSESYEELPSLHPSAGYPRLCAPCGRGWSGWSLVRLMARWSNDSQCRSVPEVPELPVVLSVCQWKHVYYTLS